MDRHSYATEFGQVFHGPVGKLQELKFEHELATNQNSDMAVYLLYQKQRYLVPKVKAAVDFLVERIKVTIES